MLLVLTGQLTFGSLDDAYMNEQVLHQAYNQYIYIHLSVIMYRV